MQKLNNKRECNNTLVVDDDKGRQMQRQWLRIIVSSIGYGLIATDNDRHILFLNPVAERITGWPYKEARSKHVGEIFNIIDSVTKRPVNGIIDKALKKGAAVQLEANALLVGKNQKEVPITGSLSPLHDESGVIIGIVLVFRDVTKRVKSEEKMSQAVKDWGAVFRALGQMTMIIDPGYGILDVNDITLEKTGLNREQIIGKRCFNLFHGALSNT